jgi:hypothetical protein
METQSTKRTNHSNIRRRLRNKRKLQKRNPIPQNQRTNRNNRRNATIATQQTSRTFPPHPFFKPSNNHLQTQQKRLKTKMKHDIGETLYCPECGCERAKIVWKSKDEKTVGVKCPRSGYHHKKNSVILVKLQNSA